MVASLYLKEKSNSDTLTFFKILTVGSLRDCFTCFTSTCFIYFYWFSGNPFRNMCEGVSEEIVYSSDNGERGFTYHEKYLKTCNPATEHGTSLLNLFFLPVWLLNMFVLFFLLLWGTNNKISETFSDILLCFSTFVQK